MTANADLKDVRDALARTKAAQVRASDPSLSAWVEANAGTGKTHVLVMRTLRILLAGTPPERVLCLTFTKAAAAEMENRLFGVLAGWATAEDRVVAARLAEVLDREASAVEIARARKLFARALETPGGLQVLTIHAFCERVLRRFPIEAGVASQFTVVDEAQADALRAEARDQVLAVAAVAEPGSPLADALATITAHAHEARFDAVLAAAIHRPGERILTEKDLIALGFGGRGRVMRAIFGVGPADRIEAVSHDAAHVLDDAALARMVPWLEAGSTNDTKLAGDLALAWRAQTEDERITHLRAALLTAKGEPRADSMITKGTTKRDPALAEAVLAARDRFAVLIERLAALRVIAASDALAVMADQINQAYFEQKTRAGVLDYDDLVARTRSLLNAGPVAAWVLFKLDGGIDHILVDEAQDTSEAQWDIVSQLAGEFFTGDTARVENRTLFAVGDEKQSIYSFQGAAPHLFAAKGEAFQAAARAVDRAFERIPLELSFRSTAAVLGAVDQVANAATVRRQLTRDATAAIRHFSFRSGFGGLCELWPPECAPPKAKRAAPDDDGDGDAEQDDSADTAVDNGPGPHRRLVARLTDQIAHWLASGETLASTGQPIRAGDILVLLKKRAPIAGPLVKALKDRGLPVAGADRIRLNMQPAVQDLLALTDFLLQPDDDLALANALKSPLYDLTDDDLLLIGHGRPASLWQALQIAARNAERFRPIVAELSHLLARADFVPPYEFFADLLDNRRGRARLLGRLGLDAADAIDEFMTVALNAEADGPPSLQRFGHRVRSATREIKRDMDQGRDEIRVMTVHGAKGLEAPIVILADMCATPDSRHGAEVQEVRLPNLPGGNPQLLVWALPGRPELGPIKAAKDRRKADDQAESARLLYVAMTRARDRLYLAGSYGQTMPQGCWYGLVADALQSALVDAHDFAGRPVRRLEIPQTAPARPIPERDRLAAPRDLPAWAKRPAPPADLTHVPISPSRAWPYEEKDEAGAELPASPSPRATGSEARFLRGRLSHVLLQLLPDVPLAERPPRGRDFLSRQGVDAAWAETLLAEVLALIAAPDLAPLFGPDSRAEVPIAARLTALAPDAAPIEIAGQIDRLARVGSEIWIADYKTDRAAPSDAAAIPEAYAMQLAAYRAAVADIFPGLEVRAGLVFTASARLLWLPGPRLDESLRKLRSQRAALP